MSKDLERMAGFIIEQEGTKCTEWSGAKDHDGYPLFWLNGKTLRASRALWEILYGPIPDGLVVRHSCDNPACLHIGHLLLGTHKENTGDALKRGRMVGPRKVSLEVADKIAALRKQGYGIARIAKELGLSVSTLYTYIPRELRRNGNYARGEDHWNFSGGDE